MRETSSVTMPPAWEVKRLIKLLFLLCQAAFVIRVIMPSPGFWNILALLKHV